MTVRELIQELEDMPQDAEVISDKTVKLKRWRGEYDIRPVGVNVTIVAEEDVRGAEVTINGEWLDQMEDPPNEFVVLQ